MDLNRDKFRKWLEEHRPRQVVGRRLSRRCCPLAEFLRSQGAEAPEVSLVRFSLDGIGRRQMPSWGGDFVSEVDCGDHTRITASRALKILDGIEQ